MAWTTIPELPVAVVDSRDASVPRAAQLPVPPNRIAGSSCHRPRLGRHAASRVVARPKLHHFGLITANLDVMVDWYCKVLHVVPQHKCEVPLAGQSGSRWRAAWIGDDPASHRIFILAHHGLSEDAQRSRHKGIRHMAFEYPCLDDLLATYARLKDLGIEPVGAADNGVTTSLHYEDPDGNRVELMVNNFEDGEQSRAFMQNSQAFASNPMGTDVDPEQMIAARDAGMSLAELHQRACAGEFCSASGFYRHWLGVAAQYRQSAAQ